jgi:flavin-dependent dehydrogenase
VNTRAPALRQAVQIAGAGPAGLAAAITLARAGRRVVVHEAAAEVGSRFRCDHQGLENWTRERDVLDELRDYGLACDFTRWPCRNGVVFDARGNRYEFHSEEPVFYLIERGPGPGALDAALLARARELGVEVRFGSRVRALEGPAIVATGPRAPDAIAVGYHFETSMPDGAWVICDDELAPQGYAYLLVMNGRGTVKSCMFSDFQRAPECVARTLERFRRLVGLEMRNARRHGGAGSLYPVASAVRGGQPLAGERAGFQDALWGFGIRLAIASGVLAARCLLEGADYEERWRETLLPLLRAAAVNRAIYARFGNPGYSRFLRRAAASGDVRRFLRDHYAPSWTKTVLYPWARARVRSRRCRVLEARAAERARA